MRKAPVFREIGTAGMVFLKPWHAVFCAEPSPLGERRSGEEAR